MESNMRSSAIFVAILSAVGSFELAAVAATPATVIFKPVDPWNIDYSDDSCALRRNFSDGKRRISLEMRQFSPDITFYLTLASAEIKMSSGFPKAGFAPDSEMRTIKPPVYLQYGSGVTGMQWPDRLLTPEEVQAAAKGTSWDPVIRDRREAKVTGLNLAGRLPPIFLQTGEMHRPMVAMRACLDELMTHWGIDAQAQHSLSQTVKPLDWEKWVPKIQADYPAEMLSKLKSGIVRVRLTIDGTGKPISCHLQMKSQDPAFETTACGRMLKFARFSPALDAGGKPIASYWTNTINYLVN